MRVEVAFNVSEKCYVSKSEVTRRISLRDAQNKMIGSDLAVALVGAEYTRNINESVDNPIMKLGGGEI
jgi:pantothenate kinase type III